MSKATTEKLKAELVEQKAGKKEPTLFESLEQQKAQVERALPAQMNAERFTRIVLTTVRATPKLAECTTQSVLAGCMVAAQLGLEPGPLGHSYLVPYWNRNIGQNEAQFQIGYKGAIDLARRSGELKDIQARTVFEGDEFEHVLGLEEVLVHKPNYEQRRKPIRYYLLVRFNTGGHYVRVENPSVIEEHRKRSKASENGPWKTDYEAMAWKTLVHMAKPWLPLTAEAAAGLALDNSVINAIGVNTVEEEAAKKTQTIDLDSEEVLPDGVVWDSEDPGRPFGEQQ